MTTALLMEEVLPEEVAIRQYVVSFPFSVRFLLASKPQVVTDVLGIVNRAISALVKKKAIEANLHLRGAELETGAITFIQRWGSSLNLNPHLHILVAEGTCKT